MLPILGPLVSPTHITVYHLVGPVSALFVPALFNLFLLAAVLAVVLLLATPSHRLGIFIWSCFFFVMPWVLLRSLATLYSWNLPHRVSLLLFGVGLLCALGFTLLWRPALTPRYESGRRLGTNLLGLAAIFGCILTIQTCWFGWQARHLNDAPSATASNSTAPAAHSLVLWIVFDEMSYAQAFESRAPGLALPTLDSFAAQSTTFTHTVPAGLYTDVVLPALMDGLPDDNIRASADGQSLNLHLSATPTSPAHWQLFNPAQTVFADAQSLGYRSAVAGWYNPYCRLLPAQLTSCFWTGQTDLTERFPARTIRANLFFPARRLLHEIPSFLFAHHVRSADQVLNAQLHINDYNDLYAAGDAALSNPSLDFVLLHLPIPHPNGIYDRHRGVLTTGNSTYLDNLALVDKYLAHVREVLIQQHRWDGATVLIMGDHSWRTRLLWTTDPRWSAEEQTASHGGQFDDRPFYALKLPNQTTPAQITQPYKATNTRSLIDALLHHEITTPQQLAQWVQAER